MSHQPAPTTQSLAVTIQKVCAVVALFVVAAIVVNLFHHFYDWPFAGPGNITKDQGLPKLEATQVLVPTDLLKFMDVHGPWLSTAEAEGLKGTSGVRNLVLFRSNGVVYSAKSVAFDGKSPWSPATTPPQITGVALQGTVLQVRTQKGDNTFTLNATEPFMVEGELSRVYVIDRANKLWVAVTGNLSFVDADQVSDPSLPPNPALSTSIGK